MMNLKVGVAQVEWIQVNTGDWIGMHEYFSPSLKFEVKLGIDTDVKVNGNNESD